MTRLSEVACVLWGSEFLAVVLGDFGYCKAKYLWNVAMYWVYVWGITAKYPLKPLMLILSPLLILRPS